MVVKKKNLYYIMLFFRIKTTLINKIKWAYIIFCYFDYQICSFTFVFLFCFTFNLY